MIRIIIGCFTVTPSKRFPIFDKFSSLSSAFYLWFSFIQAFIFIVIILFLFLIIFYLSFNISWLKYQQFHETFPHVVFGSGKQPIISATKVDFFGLPMLNHSNFVLKSNFCVQQKDGELRKNRLLHKTFLSLSSIRVRKPLSINKIVLKWKTFPIV